MFLRLPVGPEASRKAIFVGELPGDPVEAVTQVSDALRAVLPGEPPCDAALTAQLVDATIRLLPLARGTAGDVVLLAHRQDDGTARLCISAGGYRFDTGFAAWNDPRPGDADYFWGERAREVLAVLQDADWLGGLAGSPDTAALVVRVSGGQLFVPDGQGMTLVYAINSASGLSPVGFPPPGERRGLQRLFDDFAPLACASVDAMAEAMLADADALSVSEEDLTDTERADPAYCAWLEQLRNQEEAEAIALLEAEAALADIRAWEDDAEGSSDEAESADDEIKALNEADGDEALSVDALFADAGDAVDEDVPMIAAPSRDAESPVESAPEDGSPQKRWMARLTSVRLRRDDSQQAA